ncbi:LysR family transcriptional regulator [Acetobacter sacchari]|uniref:LysR family transcriptional regulator n=1 Tax=Acetobacter sacchari TaxID=2661687 RepID=A0ABS3LXL5_9PROT|nr:LysR family transcriptional regulator [Acetobacter sacchari]MBO1360662.1 LysR family transcriptional regulator [Acetobacter sacchari]
MADDQTGDLRFFISLIEAGSLTAAARSLGSSPAAISRHLARLEKRLGSTLVIRNTRHFAPSETGRVYYENALGIVAEIDQLESEIAAAAHAPRGSLNVGAPVEIGRYQIAPFIEAFSLKHPQINISLAVAAEGLHNFSDCLDVILRLGMPDEAGAVVTRLASTTRVLCASPSYLARRGVPATPKDLLDHDCLCLVRNKTMTLLNKWVIGDEMDTDVISVKPRLSTTSAEILHDWILSGQGIGYKLLCDVHKDLENGRLIRVLPNMRGETIDLYAVQPTRQHARASVQAFLRELKPHIQNLGFFYL